MKKILYSTLLSAFIFLILANFTILNLFLPQGPYTYCSDKCQFIDSEVGKMREPLSVVERNFYEYKLAYNFKNRNRTKELVLYRRFYIKWWQVWNWYDYCTHKRWSYPYASKDSET